MEREYTRESLWLFVDIYAETIMMESQDNFAKKAAEMSVVTLFEEMHHFRTTASEPNSPYNMQYRAYLFLRH
jgi:hypothetical protein